MFLSWSRFQIPDHRAQQQLHHSNEPKQIEWLCVNSASNVSSGTHHHTHPLGLFLQPSASSILCIDVVSLEFCLPSISSSITVSARQICFVALFDLLVLLPKKKDDHSVPFGVCTRTTFIDALRLGDGPGHPSILFYLLSFVPVLRPPHKPMCTFTQLV